MPLVVAHRGASAYEPENTLAAIKKAIELKADGVEVDVHQTKDKELVVIHDATVDRTTNGKGYVKDMTVEQLKSLSTTKGEKIPTLQEVIDLVRDKIYLEIEIKQQGIERDVIEKIRGNRLKNVCVSSPFPNVVAKAKKIDSKIKTSLGVATKPANILEILTKTGADKVSLNYLFAERTVVNQIKLIKKEIGVWTVNEPIDIRKMIRLNVDQITTDKPDVVIKELKDMIK